MASSSAPESTIADDILLGAEGIATFLFGRADKSTIRQVYRLTSEVRAEFRLPVFKLGSNSLRARKSAILAWIEDQENTRTTSAEASPTASPLTSARQAERDRSRRPPSAGEADTVATGLSGRKVVPSSSPLVKRPRP